MSLEYPSFANTFTLAAIPNCSHLQSKRTTRINKDKVHLLLRVKSDYIIRRPFSIVRSDIDKMTTDKWRVYGTENILGESLGDNTYRFNHRLFQSNLSKPAYLTAIVSSEGDKTKLTISVRPNYILLTVFYFSIICFFGELFGFDTYLEGTTLENLSVLTLQITMIYGVMIYFRNSLKNKFESKLRIDKKENPVYRPFQRT